VRRTAHHLPLTKNVGLMGRFLSTETSKWQLKTYMQR
jgi:hypothetical protein